MVRPGLPLGFTLQGDIRNDLHLPAVLRWRILAGNRVSAAGEVMIEDPGQLLAGVGIIAVPQEDPGPGRLEAALIGTGGGEPMSVSAPLESVSTVAARIQAVRGLANDPASRLRDEQLGEFLATWPTPTLACLEAVAALLARPADPDQVQVDPVDASVQPIRRHPGPGQAWAVVLRPLSGVLKRRWPDLPAGTLSVANQAGFRVAELYPAGDPTYTGINQHRLDLATVGLDRPLLVAVGPAREGALAAWRGSPGRWRGVVLADQDADLADPGTWTRVVKPEGAPTPLPPPNPLTLYAAGPFVLVVGTGEHDAAAEVTARLADEFQAAWAGHAHGLPPRIDDARFRAEDWRDHRLVLIGSPRSNRVLASLAPRLPAAWNDRGILLGKTARTRQPPTFCALAVADPRDAARTLVVLDGTWPAAWISGLPLALAGPEAAVLLPVPAQPGPQVAPPAKQP